ncbi:MAG TPA: hypothetical protein VLL05_06925 [Terriglobales bacterium]|nr:hypothetical protein [Terriglobales bacterium]
MKIFLANSGDECRDNVHVALLQGTFVGTHLGRFVDEVKAQALIGDAFVAARESLPVKGAGGEGFVALGLGPGEEVGGFEFASVDAVAGDAMEVEIDVYPVLLA